MSEEKMKVKGRDIVELVAKDIGFDIKSQNFNKSEWYGFSNKDGDTMRAKLVTTSDSKGFFNIHSNNIEDDNNLILLAIIQTEDKFTVIEIDTFKQKKFTVINNKDLIVSTGKEKKVPRKEFTFVDTIYKLNNIEIANNIVYGVKQRIEDDSKIDENAIKTLFSSEHICSYCGVTKDQIIELNKKEILTSRNRGINMEVDQIKAKEGYVDGNIALSCYWCNNAKTDTFTVYQFKEIARGINQAWKCKGIDIQGFEEITFWDKIENDCK